MENEIQKIECLLCGSNRVSKYFTKNNCDLFRCSECGFVFVYPVPEIGGLYENDYFSGAEAGFGYVDYDEDKKPLEKWFVERLKLVEGMAGHVGSLLDVGAATGFFMDLAEQRGWQTTGLEVSQFAIRKGKDKGLNITSTTLTELVGQKKRFDVITMFDVLEHMSDPFVELKAAEKILNNGGIILINTPNTSSNLAKLMKSRWHLIVPPEHISYFSEKNLISYLKSINFEIIKTEHPVKWFNIQYILKIASRFKVLGWLADVNKVVSKNKFGSKVLSVSLPLPTGDNIIIYAKKNEG